MRDVRVATVQFAYAPGDRLTNRDKVRHLFEAPAWQEVEIIAFSEYGNTGGWSLRHLSREP